MATVTLCKNCGLEIYQEEGLWYDKHASGTNLCRPETPISSDVHEPFVPEEEKDSGWKADMNALLTALKVGNPDNVAILADRMFIYKGRPNFAAINDFSAFAPCKIYPGEKDGFGWLTGIIEYSGKKFIFG